MRRTAVLLVGILFCAACSSSTEAPVADPLPAPIVLAGAEARAVAIDFLEAYADGRSSSTELRPLVAGSDLENWAYWLGVQNRGLDIPGPGEVQVRALRVLLLDRESAVLGLDALVTLPIRNDNGDIERNVRTFSTPIVLRRLEDGRWAVIDVVRDGRSMADSISTLNPPATESTRDARVEVASVFRFPTGTVVNYRIRNLGSRVERVVAEESGILAGGAAQAGVALTASLDTPIFPGDEVEGAITYPAVDIGAVPQAVSVHLTGAAEPNVVLALPPEAFAAGPSLQNS
jgi:hypothetical protein